MAQQNDNSGMGVVLGILLAVVIGLGAYFFYTTQDGKDGGADVTNIELPDVNVAPAAGDNAPAADAPASGQ